MINEQTGNNLIRGTPKDMAKNTATGQSNIKSINESLFFFL
jgi:hypothetical protein